MRTVHKTVTYPEVWLLQSDEIASCIYYALEEAKEYGELVQKISLQVEKGLSVYSTKVKL